MVNISGTFSLCTFTPAEIKFRVRAIACHVHHLSFFVPVGFPNDVSTSKYSTAFPAS